MDRVPRGLVTGALLALAAAAAFVFFLRGSEEQRVREVVERLTAAVRFSEGTNAVLYLARVRDVFGAELVEDAHVSASELPGGVRGRVELANAAASLGRRYRSLDVELREVDVKIDEGATTAQLTATAIVTAGEHGGGSARERRALTFTLRREDGGWRVASVTVWTREARRSIVPRSIAPRPAPPESRSSRPLLADHP